jgi:hypothetical protein
MAAFLTGGRSNNQEPGVYPIMTGAPRPGLTRFAGGAIRSCMSARTPKPEDAADGPSAREQRLAEALRANLRRRKQAAKSPGAKDTSP